MSSNDDWLKYYGTSRAYGYSQTTASSGPAYTTDWAGSYVHPQVFNYSSPVTGEQLTSQVRLDLPKPTVPSFKPGVIIQVDVKAIDEDYKKGLVPEKLRMMILRLQGIRQHYNPSTDEIDPVYKFVITNFYSGYYVPVKYLAHIPSNVDEAMVMMKEFLGKEK